MFIVGKQRITYVKRTERKTPMVTFKNISREDRKLK